MRENIRSCDRSERPLVHESSHLARQTQNSMYVCSTEERKKERIKKKTKKTRNDLFFITTGHIFSLSASNVWSHSRFHFVYPMKAETKIKCKKRREKKNTNTYKITKEKLTTNLFI